MIETPRKNPFLTAVALVVLMAGCAGPRQTIQPPSATLPLPPTQPMDGMMTHVVRPKETLWSIGKRYGVDYRRIMEANNLTDPSQVPTGMTLVIPRVGAPVLDVPLYPNTRWTHIVVHHSGTERGDARLIDRLHRKRGFINGLGYHFVIDNGTLGQRDGRVEVGHRWRKQMDGAHCDAGNMNQQGIGICLVGNFTSHRPSDEQLEALVALVETLQGYYGIPDRNVLRHKDVPGKNTACPGDRFPWYRLKERLYASADQMEQF
ncbi:MAG: N-acetylmuramoyl-L-alanine amidase [Candidatus Omnitrophica bacterium]|nr:N-acetylmuramoyl-L-alanine amidase [Candidatus Omnitrophota bacterium]